jgi:hypothetical protein
MSNSSANRSLRFAILCSESGLSKFSLGCIEQLTRDKLAEPALLVVDHSQSTPSTLLAKIGKSLRLDGNLWYLQSKLFPCDKIEAYRKTPLADCFPELNRMSCWPERKGKWSYHFSATDLAAIRSHELDFILKFTPFIVRGDLLTVARYGVWSFHHDDEEKYRGGPPAFWEIVRGDPVTGALLQRLTDRLDGGVVLKHCYVPTDGRSYRRNLQRIQASATPMARWVCLDLKAGRADYLLADASKTSAPIYRSPNDLQVLRFWWRLGRNWVDYKLANQRIDEWNIAVIEAPQAAFLDSTFQPTYEWSAYRESGQMIADPFLVPVDRGLRVMVEEFSWASEKGRICEMRAADGASRNLNFISAVIDEGVHMSYPFTFRHLDATYAIPETGATRNITLYRLDEGEGTWTRVAILIADVDAVDATILEVEGRWWLFHSGTKGAGPWSLYLWHAPTLLGPWQPHVGNPVKVDVSCSRPAGNLFWHEGRLYRPAQDGRKSYGSALAINRIEELTPSRYSETTVRRVSPDPTGPYPDGLHTLSGYGGLSVIDGKKHRWPARFLLWRFLAKRMRLAHPGFRYSKMISAPPSPVLPRLP